MNLRRRRLPTFILVTLTVLGFGFGQRPIPQPDSRKVKPSSQHYLIYYKKGDKVLTMTYLRRIIKDSTYNNKPVILSIQRYDESTGKVSHDMTVLDKQTLLPVAYQALVDQRVENYSFSDRRIKGIVSRKDSVLKQVDQVLENQTYCSVAELELLQALPLRLGYEETIQTINPGFKPSQITYKVLAEEVARINNGAIPCWVVRAVIDKREGPTYWIAKGDQQLHKMKVTLGDGNSFWKVRMVDTW